jgi:hypothetical protein
MLRRELFSPGAPQKGILSLRLPLRTQGKLHKP